ncbi:hypothetical protein PGTUg99_034297 [Puccinia graminis f. sp. tritici]|uniref:DH domain-containing protein n=1 Tax=Puccinia graminis f. sp. tritici TaxID=56615 RepID=A0A5B0RQE9_PUCGR|nr:hypothetical protein PGTUg99_034297 [Puccinia graminis f. sp. tritici]
MSATIDSEPPEQNSKQPSMDSPRPSQELASDSDSEEHQMIAANPDRLQLLAAAGLVQRPITHRQQKLPPLPPDLTSSLSIPFLPTVPVDTDPQQPTATRSRTPSTSTARDCESDNDDPLSKMEAAFARYLNIQRDLPCSAGLSVSSSTQQTSRNRNTSQTVSGNRPSSEQLKSPRSQGFRCSSRHRPSSSGSSLPSASSGFRSWLSGMSKSVSAATNPSTSANTWMPDRRQSSTGGGCTPFGNHSPRPSISGPIHPVDDHHPQPCRPSTANNIVTPSTTPSPQANGRPGNSTWSSMMNPKTLSLYPEKEKNRQEAIHELIKTEATFVENCQILSQVFYRSLEPMIGVRAATIVFANIEEIMLFGTTFLSALERRQVESGSLVQAVGDIVLDYMQGVDVFRPYCSNQANASRILSHLKLKPSIANRLNGIRVKGLELEHYLLQPMQRLTRYPLLISQIMKYTDEGSSDYNRLANALKKVQEVLTTTNKTIGEQENEIVLVTLSEQLTIPGSDAKLNLATMTRFVGRRRLIREGILTKARSRKTFRAYLFNDFFLLAKTTTATGLLESSPGRRSQGQLVMYRAPMALEECQLLVGKDDHSLVIVHNSETFTLKTPDGHRACAAWIADFKAARKEVFKVLASRRSKRASWAAKEAEQEEEEEKKKRRTREGGPDSEGLIKRQCSGSELNQKKAAVTRAVSAEPDVLNLLWSHSSSNPGHPSNLPSLNRSSIRLMM